MERKRKEKPQKKEKSRKRVKKKEEKMKKKARRKVWEKAKRGENTEEWEKKAWQEKKVSKKEKSSRAAQRSSEKKAWKKEKGKWAGSGLCWLQTATSVGARQQSKDGAGPNLWSRSLSWPKRWWPRDRLSCRRRQNRSPACRRRRDGRG